MGLIDTISLVLSGGLLVLLALGQFLHHIDRTDDNNGQHDKDE